MIFLERVLGSSGTMFISRGLAIGDMATETCCRSWAMSASPVSELGVVLSEPPDQFEGMAGKALPGSAGWNTGITLATLAGADLPTTAVDYTNLVMAGPVATVVPTP